jgi:hypothetical protein
MAEEKETQQKSDGALVAAAKTIGKAAGKIAVAVGAATPTPAKAVKRKSAKLPSKKKNKLPRKQKKAAKKAANAAK